MIEYQKARIIDLVEDEKRYFAKKSSVFDRKDIEVRGKIPVTEVRKYVSQKGVFTNLRGALVDHEGNCVTIEFLEGTWSKFTEPVLREVHKKDLELTARGIYYVESHNIILNDLLVYSDIGNLSLADEGQLSNTRRGGRLPDF